MYRPRARTPEPPPSGENNCTNIRTNIGTNIGKRNCTRHLSPIGGGRWQYDPVLPRGLGDYSGEGASISVRGARSCPALLGRVTERIAAVAARVRPGAQLAEPYPTYGGHPTHTASGSRVPYASKDTSGGYEEYARDKPRKPNRLNSHQPPVFSQHHIFPG